MKSWLVIWAVTVAYALLASWVIDRFLSDNLPMKIIVLLPLVILCLSKLFEDQISAIRSKLIRHPPIDPAEQAVLVYLRDNNLPDEVYERYDVATLQDQLIAVIKEQKLGEFDGNEFSPEEVVLFMYGPDAEKLYRGIEPVLNAYPLCKGGLAVIRYGPPGSAKREVLLA